MGKFEKQVSEAFQRVEKAIHDATTQRVVDNAVFAQPGAVGTGLPYAKAYEISLKQLFTAGTAGFPLEASGTGLKLRRNGAVPNAVVQSMFTYNGSTTTFLMFPGDEVNVPFDSVRLYLVWPANSTGSMANGGATTANNVYSALSFVRPVILQNGMSYRENAFDDAIPPFVPHALANTSDTAANARASVSGTGTWDGLQFYPFGFKKIHVWLQQSGAVSLNQEFLITPIVNQGGPIADMAFKINGDASGYLEFNLDAELLVQSATGVGLPTQGISLTAPQGSGIMLSIIQTSDGITYFDGGGIVYGTR